MKCGSNSDEAIYVNIDSITSVRTFVYPEGVHFSISLADGMIHKLIVTLPAKPRLILAGDTIRKNIVFPLSNIGSDEWLFKFLTTINKAKTESENKNGKPIIIDASTINK